MKWLQPPDWWHDGDEPDYRFSLANERTFLAWVRTALALAAGAIALNELVDPFAFPGGRRILAIACAALSALLAIGALRRWAAVQRAMRGGRELPFPPLLRLLAVATVIAAAFIVVVVITQ